MKPIRAVIVEDEPKSMKVLISLLEMFHAEIQVVQTATSITEAIEAIKVPNFELLFLDVNLSDGNSLDMIKSEHQKRFNIIFTTAHEKYASKAFHLNALHYLLKPINPEELGIALERHKNSPLYQEFEEEPTLQLGKLPISSKDGLTLLEINEIVRIQSSDKYAVFHMLDKKQHIISKALSKYEVLLKPFHFYRVHDRHLVNLKHVKTYNRSTGEIELSDDSTVIASQRKKDDLIKIFNIKL